MSLAEALPAEIQRVQKIIKLYHTVPNGQFATALMQLDVDTALKAMAEGDLPGMITAYQALQIWEED